MNIINEIYKNKHVRKFLPEGKIEKVIITVHGFAGDKDSSVIFELAKEMTKHNCAVIAFDLPNHGENDSLECLKLEDCINALHEIDEMVKVNYIDKPISYFATSFGGYLLLNLLSNKQNKYDKIILRAPAINMDKILGEIIIPEHGYTLDQLKKESINLGYEKPLMIDSKFYNDLKNTKLINSYENNNFLYVIQGKKDDVVNYKDNEKFFNEKCDDNYKIYYFENADHRFKNPGELVEIVKIAKNIINEE